MFLHSFEHGLAVRSRGAGRPLVYIHGLGETGMCFDGLARHAALADRRHLLVDLPGYGRSPHPTTVGDLVAVADQLADWLTARAIAGDARPVLIGHSMGGVLGTLIAERHPALLGGLIDVDGNVSSGDCTFSAGIAAQPLEGFVTTGIARMADSTYRDGIEHLALRGAYAGLRLADPRAIHRHAQDLVAMSAAEDLADRLARLRCPTGYLAGVPGGACPRSLELLERAGVPLIRIEPAGHWPFVDQLEASATAIAGLLRAWS